MATMDGANRKIELQSPEDLTYLINNVRRAAAEHIGAAFPPVEGDDAEEDELRVRIEGLVNDYITQTFTLAAPNLSINGFDLDPKTFPAVYLSDPTSSSAPGARTRRSAAAAAEIQYEPFDARKRTRLEALAREEEDLMREVAALKRGVPAAAARGYADAFWEGLRADEEGFEAAKARAVAIVGGDDEQKQEEEVGEGEGEEDGGGKEKAGKRHKKKKKSEAALLLEGLGAVERVDDVERGYLGVVNTLGRLKREMPATVAKMERARVAGEYVVTEK